MKKVKYKGQILNLDTKCLLGTGGEADVVKYNHLAFKLYHSPTPTHCDKLFAFIKSNFNLPPNVAKPLDPVFDKNGTFAGFTMQVAKPPNNEVMKLSNKVYRNKTNTTLPSVLKVFKHAKETVDAVHQAGLIIGDLNDLNILFTNEFKSIFIDVDSFQFGQYPCPVGTDQFIDPTLLNKDLTQAPLFTHQTDWYAFAVMLFKSLLYVHPYGGKHKVKNMFERITRGIYVMNDDVVYPKIGLNPDTLSDDLLHYFSRIFLGSARINLPPAKLDIGHEFRLCAKCNTWYHFTRTACPQCSKPTIKQAVTLISTKTVDNQTCECKVLFEAFGTLQFVKVIDTTVHAWMHKPDGECIHTNVTGFSRRPIDNGDSYDVLHSLAPDLINRNVHNKGNDIYIESKLTTTTLSFGGVPQWGCSDQWLYRLTPTMLMRGRFEYGNYVESPVTTTLENQTRFWVGYNDMVLGFMRIFGGYQYFVVTNGNMYTTKVPNVPGKIIEQDAKFSGDKCLLLMKTLYKGRTYSYMYLLNGKGEILTERSEESLNSDLLRNIYGKELVGSTILHPTDDGIVMEKGSTITLKSATEPYVNSGCRLLMYKHGILVIDRQQIKYLTLS